jgi:O-antigen ligase
MIVVYLLISAMPLTRHPLWSELAADFTMIKYLGALGLAYAVIHLRVRQTPVRFFGTAQARWFIALSAVAMLSYFTEGSRLDVWERSPLMNYVSFLLFFVILLIVVDSEQRLRWVLLWAIGGVAFASMHLLREWQKYGQMGEYRPGWVTGDSNYFTISAVACLPVAIYLGLNSRERWQRIFCLGSALVIFAATVVAASRGGFLGRMVACLFGVLRSERRARNLVVLSLALVATLLAPVSPLRRMLLPAASDTGSADTRTALWSVGFQMISDEPLTGVGLGNFKAVLKFYGADELNHIAHNSFVEIAAEMGIPALLIFLAMIVTSLWSLERVRRFTRGSPDSLIHAAACGIQAGVLGDAIALIFVSGQSQKLFWLMLFLSMCLPPLARLNEASESAPHAEPTHATATTS